MSDDKNPEEVPPRRRIALAIGGVALFGPTSWQKPVVDSVLLPAHAQTSPGADDPSDPGKCKYQLSLNCATGMGTVCTKGKEGCMQPKGFVVQLFYNGAPVGKPKKVKSAALGECAEFKLFNPKKAKPGEYYFTATPKPDGKVETSNTCTVKDGGDPPDPKDCTYTATLDCENGKGKVCTAGDSGCENAKKLEIRIYKDGTLIKGPKAISPADPGKCREFKVFDPDKAEPGQYHFTATPTGGSPVTSNTCTVEEEEEPPEEECKGEKKIEGSKIGEAPQTITLGDYEFKITGWTEKGDSPGEYVGFTLDKPACFAVKSGLSTENDCGTSWVNPNGTSGPSAKGISNITFKCPPK